jgi:uncharacterized lipoprotein YajG
MKKIMIFLGTVLLAGCQTPPAERTPETVSPGDYQACIQAAKSGNGAASETKCDKVIQDTH